MMSGVLLGQNIATSKLLFRKQASKVSMGLPPERKLEDWWDELEPRLVSDLVPLSPLSTVYSKLPSPSSINSLASGLISDVT